MTSSHNRGRVALLLIAVAAVAASVCPSRASAQAAPPAAKRAADSTYARKPRADTAPMTYTHDDVFFMQGMISHHAQAIVMARWAPTHGASPWVRTLCERIINAQTDEIVLMQQWLRDRHQTVPEAKPAPMKMKMNGMEQEMLMPGMLTDAQLSQLDAARGAEFDRLFLRFMIQHHKGAVSMVKDLFATDGAGQDELVFKFASDVNVDQTTEIARMQDMLAHSVIGPP
jgi:uncharacterized protein (DUF305 family)